MLLQRFTALTAMLFCQASFGQSAVALGGVALLQPEQVIGSRVQSSGALADYIKRVQAEAEHWFASKSPVTQRSGFIVLAVRPAQQSTAWFDLAPPLNADETEELRAKLKRVLPMVVSGGSVVFALKVGIHGGQMPAAQLPSPPEWNDEVRRPGQAAEVGEFVLRVWR